jgi:hypothetical protein
MVRRHRRHEVVPKWQQDKWYDPVKLQIQAAKRHLEIMSLSKGGCGDDARYDEKDGAAASSSDVWMMEKVSFANDVRAQATEEQDKYEVECKNDECLPANIGPIHMPKKVCQQKVDGWEKKDLEKRWGWKWIWIDPKPARCGYRNSYEQGWWAYHEVWLPSKRQECIRKQYKLRKVYMAKLDACKKWCLKHFLSVWYKEMLDQKPERIILQ